MWPPLIVMDYPLAENSPQMFFVDRDEEIQALSANRPDEPFAECIGLRRLHRSLENRQTHALHTEIQGR